jgi:hypothetical protein
MKGVFISICIYAAKGRVQLRNLIKLSGLGLNAGARQAQPNKQSTYAKATTSLDTLFAVALARSVSKSDESCMSRHVCCVL